MAVSAFFCVKPLSWRGPRGLGLGLKPLLKDKKRLVMLVKRISRHCLKECESLLIRTFFLIHKHLWLKLWLLYKYVSWANSFPHPNPQIYLWIKLWLLFTFVSPKTLSVLSVLSVYPNGCSWPRSHNQLSSE